MNLLELLNWRYATKRMLDKKVPEEKVNEILEAIRMSASSGGLQPYRVVVISNKEVKQRLQEASFNKQVSECSHLLVFAARETTDPSHIDEFVQMIIETRGTPAESLEPLRKNSSARFASLSQEFKFNWAARQAYIGLGTGLIAAANLQVDACPMEGFEPEKFDEILGLKERGLKSVVMMALGYRNEELDKLGKMKKVRVPMEKFVVRVEG